MQYLQTLADRWHSTVADWPCPHGPTLGAIGLGLVVCAASIALICMSASRWGGRLLGVAVAILKQSIWAARCVHGEVSLAEVHQAATQIRQETGCVVLTAPVIAEAVREMSAGTSHLDRVLESLVVDVRDTGGFKPASIAENDRIFAYTLSGISVSLAVLCLQFLLSSSASSSLLAAGGVWLLLLPQAWMALLAMRACLYWRGRCLVIEAAQIGRLLAQPPRELSKAWDFFAWIASEDSYATVSVKWAPLWETLCFGLLPCFFGWVSLWVTHQLLTGLAVSPEVVSQVFLVQIGTVLVLFLAWGAYVFALFHEYKWREARRLRRRLGTLRRDCKLFALGVIRVNPIRDYHAVATRLWIITGDEAYRHLADSLA